jgi:hypothetical protein
MPVKLRGYRVGGELLPYPYNYVVLISGYVIRGKKPTI